VDDQLCSHKMKVRILVVDPTVKLKHSAAALNLSGAFMIGFLL